MHILNEKWIINSKRKWFDATVVPLLDDKGFLEFGKRIFALARQERYFIAPTIDELAESLLSNCLYNTSRGMLLEMAVESYTTDKISEIDDKCAQLDESYSSLIFSYFRDGGYC